MEFGDFTLQQYSSENEARSYSSDYRRIAREGVFIEWIGGYIFSDVADTDKYSRDYMGCLALIIAGNAIANPNKQLSFLAHINPTVMYSSGDYRQRVFGLDFKTRLEQIRLLTLPETRGAAVLAGHVGTIQTEGISQYLKNKIEYFRALKALYTIVEKHLDITPIVLSPPKKISGTSACYSSVFYDTQRRLVILTEQPQQ
jgi:hypothetical protein